MRAIGKSGCQPSWSASGEGARGGGEGAGVVEEVAEDHDLAAGPADAGHLGDHALGLGHHRDEVHRHHGVEAGVGEVERPRVHPAQRDDVGEAEVCHLRLGAGRASRRRSRCR